MHIRESPDLTWAGYPDTASLLSEFDGELARLHSGHPDALDYFRTAFLPTSTFQEASLSNGWGRDCNALAAAFDRRYPCAQRELGAASVKQRAEARQSERMSRGWLARFFDL